MCIRIHLVHGACEPRLVHRREKRMDTFALYRVLYRPVPDAYRYTPYLHAPRRFLNTPLSPYYGPGTYPSGLWRRNKRRKLSTHV